MPRPVVAIVGRPNVGKSTLFNRLIGERQAIVEDQPGITRDRVYGHTDWIGMEFTIIDTGGLGLRDEDPFGAIIQEQAEIAMEEADLILFMVDAREGRTPLDEELAEMFRRTGRPVIVIANKADNPQREFDAHEFYALGLGEVFFISSHSGRGVADLLDMVVEHLRTEVRGSGEAEEEEDDQIKVAIVGRPNVGKSSLLNAILGEQRVIVSPIAGTTRDVVDVPFEFGPHKYLLLDTAGIRRRGKIQGSIEYYMVLRAERAVERADVAVVVVDAADGLTDGDKRVMGMVEEAGRACVMFVNKWDLMKGTTPREFGANVRKDAPFVSWAPIVVGSAEKGRGLTDLLETCADAANNHSLRISTGELNRVLREAQDKHPYTSHGRDFKIYYATMAAVKPPTIVVFVNDPKIAHLSYLRYLENQLRAHFGFTGTPIRLLLRKRTREMEEAGVT